jgi:molybdopterin/thiamine biosynthesis adenylyltransferase/rhodanese-related sulfurtransferase
MALSGRDLLNQTKQGIREVTVPDTRKQLDEGRVTLIDVREQDEYEQGFIPGATWIPRGFLELRIDEKVPKRETPIILYCAGGNRSAFAAKTLQDLGYQNVWSMQGGYGRWKEEGYKIETPVVFTRDQKLRYSRHLLIPEVGEAGQAKLLKSKVLLLGAGGLGSPAGYYLAAAGVGRLGIIDSDVVDASNLQRQILHSTATVGKPKVESARATITNLNPDVQVDAIQDRLTTDNVLEIIKPYDVIVNGADNFPTRYLLNDACLMLKKPIVDGSIFRFEGQATVYMPFKGPCYRCLFPVPPPPDLAPSCDEAGVLGVLPGIVGLIQATETLKLLLGRGRPLVGRLLTYDALDMKFRELKLKQDPSCPVCGPNAKPIELIDYIQFCAGAGSHKPAPGENRIDMARSNAVAH